MISTLGTESCGRLVAIMRTLVEGGDLRRSLEAVCAFVETELAGDGQVRASILRCDEDGRLRSACSPSLPADYLNAIEGVPAGEEVGICGTLAGRDEIVISADISTDPNWSSLKEIARRYDLAACWSHPVRDRDDRVTACLAVYTDRRGAPNEAQIGVLAEAATIAGLAIERHRTERATAAELDRLHRRLDGSQDGAWDWHIPTGWMNFGARWDAMLGYAPGDTDPHLRTWEQLVHPEDKDAALGAIDDHLKGRTPIYENEHRLRTKGGTWRWILDRGEVVEWDALGNPVRMVGTHTDITTRKEQELELRAAKARYKAIVETAADAIITMGEDRRIVAANPATAKVFGWTVTDLIGKPIETLMPVSDRTAHVAHVNRYVDGGSAKIIGTSGRRLEGCRKDGSTFPISLSITEWQIDGSRHFTGIIRDISREVAAEAKLRAREAETRKLALVADKTTNAVIITDAASRIEWVNKGFERLCGFTAEEAIGRKPGALLQGADTDPAEVRRIAACIAAGRGFQAELVNYTKAGEPYWVAIDCEPVTGTDGAVERFIAVERDVTEHKRLAERLLRAERVANVGNWVLDVATRRLSWSDEIFRILEMSPASDELTLSDVLALYHPDDRADVQRQLDGVIATGRPVHYCRRLLINGAVKWVEIRCEGERDANGAVVRVFGTCQDVTTAMEREAALVAAREQADAANRAKSEFLATMSHELRTPLNAILGYTEIMAAEMYAPLGHARYREYAQDILTSGRYLLTMIENVLDLSRMEAERVTPDIADVACGTVVDRALTLVEPSARQKGIRLSGRNALDVATVRADGALLQHVFVNVLDNAIKFTGAGGDVSVSSRIEDGQCAISIADTGVGIPAQHLDKVVRPFYRVRQSGSEIAETGGTGIGLALSERFVRAMGGRLEIASAPDQGTTVTITLPLSEVAPHRVELAS